MPETARTEIIPGTIEHFRSVMRRLLKRYDGNPWTSDNGESLVFCETDQGPDLVPPPPPDAILPVQSRWRVMLWSEQERLTGFAVIAACEQGHRTLTKVEFIDGCLPHGKKAKLIGSAFESFTQMILQEAKSTSQKQNPLGDFEGFFQSSLRKAVFNTPEKEAEIQDTIEQLLIGRGLTKGLDYDRETGRVKVSIKEVIPDFIFPKLDLALEVKLSKDKGKSKAIVDEINADIRAYGKKYPFQLFVVYDLGTIRDEVEFKQDLETADSVSVVIVKH